MAVQGSSRQPAQAVVSPFDNQQSPMDPNQPKRSGSQSTSEDEDSHDAGSEISLEPMVPPPMPATLPYLDRVVAIPATERQFGSPFLRAYAPALKGFGITREVFLQIVDNLNRVTIASPPLQALNLAGTVVGFVPDPAAQIVSTVVNVAATAATVAVAKSRAELLIREVNKTIFKPRGLQVQIAKLAAVAKLANIPILTEDGKIDKGSKILVPLEETDDIKSVGIQERRVKALQPWTSELVVEGLPDISVPNNSLSRINSKISERTRKWGENSILKSRVKKEKKYEQRIQKNEQKYEDDIKGLERKATEIREKDSDKTEKKLAKLEKKRDKLDRKYERGTVKADEKREKGDKEEKGIRKIFYLIVMRTDQFKAPESEDEK